MKSKTAVLALAVAALFTPACEKHTWNESKQLFEGHKAEAHGEKASGHEEKKAEGHEAAK
jgi:hypothetical protein